MDNSYPNPAPGDEHAMSKKTVLLRLAVFVLALFATHVLLLWLHPMGQHQFFGNLVLAALSFWVILRLAMPHLKDKSTEIPVSRAQIRRLRELFKL
jgi:hypothetical protein